MKKCIIYILSFSIITAHGSAYAYGSSTDMTLSPKDLLGYDYNELPYQNKEQRLNDVLDVLTETKDSLSSGEDIDLEVASMLLMNVDESQVPSEHLLAWGTFYEHARFLNKAGHRIDFLRKIGFRLDRLDLYLMSSPSFSNGTRADIFNEIDAQMLERKPLNKDIIELKFNDTKKRLLPILEEDIRIIDRRAARSRIWRRIGWSTYTVVAIAILSVTYYNDHKNGGDLSRQINNLITAIKPVASSILDLLVDKIDEMKDALAQEISSRQSRPDF